MSILPTFTRINGSGKPRVLVIKNNAAYTSSSSTTFTATTVAIGGTVSLATVRAGMRARSYVTRASLPSLEVYGRITAVNDSTDTITVAEWVGGTPTDGQVVTVDGYVIDLPYCQGLVETFSPDQLIHSLYRSRKASVFYGWKYSVTLDYSVWIAADTLINLSQALNISAGDKIVLIPRVDKPGTSYNVIYSGDISLQRFGYGPGHKGVQLSFVSTENVAWPIPTSGYGFGYGTNYGTQL